MSSNEQFNFGPARKQLSSFTGATGTTGGSTGLVPAPSASDNTKFLKGDGTWAEPSGKADKVSSATNGNLAGLDSSGNLTDSGKKPSDFILASTKGTANGVAELDANGKVPASQLPSYVDDVESYSSVSAFPATGETGKVYIAEDTNLTYRWSGSAYVSIGNDLALGTTSSTAFRGDYGSTAYQHATDTDRITSVQTSKLYKIAVSAEGHVSSVSEVQKSDITGLGIPAQDTTYSAFTGAGASAAGSSGLVPAPSSGDQDKFLKGDGTWGVINSFYRQFWTSAQSISIALAANGKTHILWSAGSSAGTAGAMMDTAYGAIVIVSNGEYAVIHKGSSITVSVANNELTISTDTGIKMGIVEL